MNSNNLRNEIEKILCDFAEQAGYLVDTSKSSEATSQILSLLEEAVGEEWHHNSATWCAGANTRRKDILNKINPRERTE